MAVKIDLVAVQVAVSHGREKTLCGLPGRHTVAIEHIPRDPGQSLTGDALGVREGGPFRGRTDQAGP